MVEVSKLWVLLCILGNWLVSSLLACLGHPLSFQMFLIVLWSLVLLGSFCVVGGLLSKRVLALLCSSVPLAKLGFLLASSIALVMSLMS